MDAALVEYMNMEYLGSQQAWDGEVLVSPTCFFHFFHRNQPHKAVYVMVTLSGYLRPSESCGIRLCDLVGPVRKICDRLVRP